MTFFTRALALLALVFAVPALAADATAPLSQLVDKNVVDARNNIMAQVKDLLVDTQDNRVAFAVLAVGDFLNGYKNVIYPLTSGLAPISGNPVRMNSSKAVLGNLDAVPEDPRYRLATEILAAHVRDRGGKDIAAIKDLLVKTDDGTLAGFVVEFDKAYYPGGGLVALPPSSLSAKEKDFVANFEPKDIRPAGPGGKPAPPPVDTSIDRDLRATELLGTKVTDAKGNDVGELRDLLVTRDNRVAQVVLALPGGRLVAAAPPLKGAAYVNGKVALDADVKAFPAFVPNPDPAVLSVTRLVHAGIADPKGEKVGSIADVVVNLGTGQVHYAVAEFNASWIEKGKLVVVPVKNVRASEKEGLVLGMALEDLKGTMFFDKGGWPDLNESTYRGYIDKYLKSR